MPQKDIRRGETTKSTVAKAALDQIANFYAIKTTA
jgi:hypothetical protein